MGTPLRVLVVEDSEDDAILMLRELRRGGYDPTSERVDTPQAMNAALDQQTWDIVLADYAMPRFSMPAALAMVKEKGLGLPFIIVSGAIGEEAAVAAMRAGAHDYVMKSNLARLIPAVERELREADMRREHKKAEKALRESEQKYRSLFENMLNGFAYCRILLDENDRPIDFVYLEVNDAFERLTGLKRENVVGKKVTEAIPGIKEANPELFDIYGKVALTRKEDKFDIHFEPLDIWVSISVYSPRKGYFVALFENITERKQAEEVLLESEERFRDLFENANDLIQSVDANGRFVFVNRKWLETLGYSQQEVGKLNLTDILRNDQIPHCMELFQRVCRGESVEKVETVFVTKDGREVYVEGNSNPRFKDGKFVSTRGIFRDVTEHKQAEEALRESEQKYRTILEDIEDGYYEVDIAGNLTFFNDAMCRINGYSKDEMMGMNNRQYMDKENAKKVYQAFNRVYTTGKHSRESGWEVIRKDGTKRFVEASVSLRRNPEGEPVGFRGIARDITERKRAEEALRQSEHNYRVLFESMIDGMIVIDAETLKIVLANQNAAKMYGFDSVEEVLGANLLDYIHPDDRERALRAMAEDMFEKDLRQVNEFRTFTKDGREIWVDAIGTRIEYQGRLAGLTSFRDITERKHAEEALHKSEEKLKRYLESTPDAVYVNDLKGTFLYGNRAAETMTGYSREELIGKSFLEVVVLPAEYLSKAAQNLELNAAGTPTGPDEFELIRKDGSRVFVEISTYPIGKGVKTEVIGIARDITERKGMEQQLQLAGRLAAVGELAAGVAHELNNPLAAVQMYAELLNERDDLDEIIRSDVETIYTETQRATRITSNLLSFARRHLPEKRLISINDVIEKALELHAYHMRVNNIDLVMELDPDLPMTMADFHQMEQVFVNIINNAEQAMTEAHGRGKLSVKTQRVGKRIKIDFTDDGPGISEKNLKRLFDPFFTTKEVGEGTGLGLSICYGLIQEHVGHISVRSKPGEGATFVVSIPIVSEDQRTAQEADSIQVQGI